MENILQAQANYIFFIFLIFLPFYIYIYIKLGEKCLVLKVRMTVA